MLNICQKPHCIPIASRVAKGLKIQDLKISRNIKKTSILNGDILQLQRPTFLPETKLFCNSDQNFNRSIYQSFLPLSNVASSILCFKYVLQYCLHEQILLDNSSQSSSNVNIFVSFIGSKPSQFKTNIKCAIF